MLTVRSLLVITAIAWPALGQFCEHQWEGQFAERGIDAQEASSAEAPDLDIRPLIISGPSSNRVDLIFFGDGYTEEEKEKFFEDALFLATNVTDDQTFADVLPTMNWWAGFTASAESGIGVGGQPKDTVYGLYRDGTELRGVYYDKPEVARAACQSTDACDYPILLGNDPFYGGLGGTFTVITSSIANGPAVLRHELGHSIIGVGEEYDGGQVYRGVNSASSPDSVPWTEWYTDPSSEPKIQRSNMPIQAYPWTILNATEDWSQSFTSAGTYDSYLLSFSVSGVEATEDLRIQLDGEEVAWQYNPAVGKDRYIYDVKFDSALSPGAHELTFGLENSDIEGTAQLCNLQIVEYGEGNDEFNFEPEYHGLYPTYSATNTTTYRPTNDYCLMRTMHSPNFCSACIEGLWISLMRPIDLIDNTTTEATGDGLTNVTLELLPLAQFREEPRPSESYIITWFAQNGTTLDEWQDKASIVVDESFTEIEVEVEFTTTQVRVDENDVLKDRRTIEL